MREGMSEECGENACAWRKLAEVDAVLARLAHRRFGTLVLVLLAVWTGLAAAVPPGCLPAADSGRPADSVVAGRLVSPPFSDLYGIPAEKELPGELVIYFLDTGQSDAAYVRTPGGKVLVVDAGDIDNPGKVVGFLTSVKKVSKVDALVLTHPHADHIGDALAILQRLTVGQLWLSGFPHTTPDYEAVLAEAADLKEAGRLTVRLGRAGDNLDLGDDKVSLTFYHPVDPLGDDANEASLVLKITYGSFSVLFTGDVGASGERAMLDRGGDLGATVLKVAHHGSAGSTGAAFLAAVDPEVAVIDVGADNPYGHPSPETLARLEAAGVAVFRTDRDGTIIVHSDGEAWGLVTRGGG